MNRPAAAVAAMPAPGYEERRFSASDGLMLAYRVYGPVPARGPAVLCLPGLTRNAKDFDDLALRLAGQGRRVVCPDYRGRGRSAYDRNWRNYRPEIYVADLVQLMTVEGLTRTVAIGTSMGGLLTLGLAVARPAALVAAVLNDVGPDLEPAGVARILDYVGHDHPQPDWASAVAHLKATYRHLGYDSETQWLKLAQSTFREGEDGQLHVDWDVSLARPLRRVGPRPDLWPLFRALGRRPVLVVRGGCSDVLSEACLARMIAEKPGLMHVTLPGVAHAPTLDEPAALEAIDALFTQLDRDLAADF
jgi:pimeloyl-ACP methyl ester carboxylesterase